MDMPAPATTTAKPVFKSKTILMNLLFAIAACFPAVQEMVSADPMLVVLVISLANGLLRMVTREKVTLISEDATGMVRLMMLGGTAAGLMTSLPSCASLADLPITGTLSFRDAGSGAKASLTVGNEASRYKAPKARPICATK